MIREDKNDTNIEHRLIISRSFAKCFACITSFHFQNDYRVGPIIFILLMSNWGSETLSICPQIT